MSKLAWSALASVKERDPLASEVSTLCLSQGLLCNFSHLFYWQNFWTGSNTLLVHLHFSETWIMDINFIGQGWLVWKGLRTIKISLTKGTYHYGSHLKLHGCKLAWIWRSHSLFQTSIHHLIVGFKLQNFLFMDSMLVLILMEDFTWFENPLLGKCKSLGGIW